MVPDPRSIRGAGRGSSTASNCPAGKGGAVAILNRNEPAFYCIPAAEYEAMLDLIEDAELNAIADARASSPEVAVSLDDL